jgi:hypothetical protein
MNRDIISARLKAITYASGKAHVTLSKGDTSTYFS